MNEERPIQEQLERAVRDLWSMMEESGDGYVVFMDHRRMSTRVEETEDGLFRVSWENDDGTWQTFDTVFDNPREAAFHAYQGPH